MPVMKRTKKSKKKRTVKPERLKTIILTESSEKAKTIRKCLGRQYLILSSDGFLRDLPKTQLGIDIENNFEPKYITVRGKGKLLEQLKKETLTARRIYLATDPDAEGEMLALHYCNLFGISASSNCRMILNEITKQSVKLAIENAKAINMRLIEEYETRRVINRLFMFQINPLLWSSIYTGISIRRDQAIFLKLICDQEKKLQSSPNKAIEIDDTLEEQSDKPFNLKTLQMAAAKELNFHIGITAITLKQLYEGVNLENIHSGLISYYKNDEICPSSDMREPESLKDFLTLNQWKLYNLIWKRYNKKETVESEKSQNIKAMVRYDDYLLMRDLESKKLPWAETFAVSMCTMLKRQYIELTDEGYKPTDLGNEIMKIIKDDFALIIGTKMTQKIESQINEVYEGKADKIQVINAFYKIFSNSLKKAYDKFGGDLTPKEPPLIETDKICEKCGRKMVIKRSRYGSFLACQGYPECKNTKPYFEYTESKCPKCGSYLTRHNVNKNRTFYRCEHFPNCDFSTWDEPQNKNCDICGSTMFLHKFKDRAAMLYCSNVNCRSRTNHPINAILENVKNKSESRKKLGVKNKN